MLTSIDEQFSKSSFACSSVNEGYKGMFSQADIVQYSIC